MKKFSSFAILCIWLAGGLYFGVTALSKLNDFSVAETGQKDAVKKNTVAAKDAKTFPDSLKKHSVQIKNTRGSTVKRPTDACFFGLIHLTRFNSLLLTSMSFGLLGAIINILLAIVANKTQKIEDVHFISHPLLGALTGLVVVGLVYMAPSLVIKVNSPTEIKPLCLMFFCLYCGIYSEQFYKKLAVSLWKKES